MRLPTRTDEKPPVYLAHPFDAKLEALTAAAVKANAANSGMFRRLVQPWQILALSYYDRVGECWNAAQFYSRSLKKVRLFAGEIDGNGELTETENPEALAVIARIQDPGGGGYSRLLDAYGRLKFMIGEGYFLVLNPDGDDESWEFVSPDELRINGADSYTRFQAPSLPAEEFKDVPDDSYEPVGDEALVYRAWRPHPRYSKLADSPIRAQLRILEELELLTLAVGATAKNRMVTSGILYVPDTIVESNIDSGEDEDANAQTFLRDLTAQMLAPLTNPGSAGAAAPVLMVGPAEAAEQLKWLQISDPTQTYPEEGLRTELIRRFAVGVEMPSEILTGTADVNHWGAWLIDEQGARDYIFPLCEELCGELTSVFMRPVLREAGVTDYERFVFAYDAAAVVAHPDASKDAKDLHDRLVISDATLRERTNFTDDDAPSEEEWQRRAALKLLDPSALTYPYEDDGPGPDLEAQETGAEGSPQGNSDVEQQAPGTNPSENPDQRDTQTQSLAANVAGACSMAVMRSREIAGARIRDLVLKENGGADTNTAEVENHKLAASLGADWVRARTNRTEQELCSGANRSLVETLVGWGAEREHAEHVAQAVTNHAARTLYREAPGPLPLSLTDFISRAVS